MRECVNVFFFSKLFEMAGTLFGREQVGCVVEGRVFLRITDSSRRIYYIFFIILISPVILCPSQ